jgi:predicted NodU family carbamoyl transferase
LRDDHPEFCLFGSRCLNESVRKAIKTEYQNYSKVEYDEIPDEVIDIMLENQILEVVVF